MTENNPVGTRANLARIAGAQGARPKVDANGKPIGPPTKYTYDANGLLVTATPGESAEADAT